MFAVTVLCELWTEVLLYYSICAIIAALEIGCRAGQFYS